jgi:hypothetical protein
MSVHDGNYKLAKKNLGIPEDEPIFVLRAQDALSCATLARYINLARAVEPTKSKPVPFQTEWYESMKETADEFLAWQRANQKSIKLPD